MTRAGIRATLPWLEPAGSLAPPEERVLRKVLLVFGLEVARRVLKKVLRV